MLNKVRPGWRSDLVGPGGGMAEQGTVRSGNTEIFFSMQQHITLRTQMAIVRARDPHDGLQAPKATHCRRLNDRPVRTALEPMRLLLKQPISLDVNLEIVRATP